MSDKNNNSMLALFRSEAKTHTGRAIDALERYTSEADEEHLSSATDACQALLSSSKLVNVSASITIIEAVKELLHTLKGNPAASNTSAISTCSHLLHKLAEIAQIDDESLLQWHEKNQDELNSLTAEARTAADNIVQANAEEQQQETPEHEPPVPAATETAPATPAPATQPSGFTIDATMLELFSAEVDTHTNTLSQSLLDLETKPGDPSLLEGLMRAAHSIKGAARMVGITPAVEIAHVMEDCFVAAQEGAIELKSEHHDTLLTGVDLLASIARVDPNNAQQWATDHADSISSYHSAIKSIMAGKTPDAPLVSIPITQEPKPAAQPTNRNQGAPVQGGNVIRISADRINRLMGMSGEFMVSSGWVNEYNISMLALKKQQSELASAIDKLRSMADEHGQNELVMSVINDVQSRSEVCRNTLSQRLTELEDFDRRTEVLANRLNHEVISTRMRPFGDGITGYKRMVRDVSKSLNKKVQLEIEGLDTQVDRDILEKIDAPLNHILRNAIDHGLETPEERVAAGKPECGTIKLEAFHNAGMLSIVISDDGRGIDLDKIRKKITARNMVSQAMADEMSEAELLDFLFLPGFSTRENVTDISGRGVGLDVVHTAIQEMRGQIRSQTKLGHGLKINLQLPLTLSVIRSLLFYLGNELYAIPLARINHITKLPREEIEVLEDRQYFTYKNENIGLIDAGQILGIDNSSPDDERLNIIMIGDRSSSYGIVVNKLLGERDLAVHPLDPRLGRVKDINAAAITDGGEPVLIIDVDDLVQSIENLVSGRRVQKVKGDKGASAASGTKRILVVDDSLTVREIERKLLESRGYDVDIAVDGVDGWNAVRTSNYSLVISDIDMPRMNGIEFVSLIKQDNHLKSTPVMIVSYKDREEDRAKGLDAGADYYLTKGSFHDESLIEAVIDLIGEA